MWFAKSEREETIREHTEKLLANYTILRKHLFNFDIMSERDWDLLCWAVKYHDIGKFDLVFQNRIHKKLGKNQPFNHIERKEFIPHNYLSVAMIPFENLDLTEDEEKILIQSVGYHHERDVEPNIDQIVDTVENEILKYKAELESHMGFEIANEAQELELLDLLPNNRIKPSESNYQIFTKYVLLKGLLHRLDHSASAYLDVEIGIDEEISLYVNQFFQQCPTFKKRPLQIFAEENKDAHLIAIAQTGMGKTEAALLWAGDRKTFFTLPLRVSLNAMYLRVIDEENIGFPKQYAGLLHSSSADILEEEYEEEAELLRDQSRNLSSKLLFTTIDQILKFPFFYKGFEKELAAMAGAKVIIDEIQAYDPKIAAMLIRALELIDQIGGTFMIMTATFPAIYLNAIKNNSKIKRKPVIINRFYDDETLRHRIKIREQSILDNIDVIAQSGMNKKVLVICNTVQRAKDVYQSLVEKEAKVRLLHSLYMPIHRQELENDIKDFSDSKNEVGIWVTTQLVEASLDIDFDELYTEFSSLDSQFQRYGRCYRKRKLDRNDANIFVYTEDLSDKGAIYQEEIICKGLELLKPYDGQLLKESKKMEMVEILYTKENLKGTEFLEDFEKTIEFFKYNSPYKIKNKEAQDYLRDIQNIKVLPYNYEAIHQLIEEYRQSSGEERFKIRKKIERHAISVNKYRVKSLISQSGLPASLKDFYFIESAYEIKRINGQLVGQGLIIEKVEQRYFS